MPRKTKVVSHLNTLNEKRYSTTTVDESDGCGSSEEFEEMESDSNNMADDEVVDFQAKISIENIADVFELCQATCPVRYLSVLMYMSLRHLGIKWTDSDNILRQIGAFKSETSHKWSKAFLSGDFDEFVSENRGGKHSPDFWNYFPEIEISAKQFTLERCSQKVASFTSMDLALFIDTAYYETIGITKDTDSELIRSVSSCRNDLRRWGATFKENGARPYFEGRERQDVVEMSDDPQLPGWQVPTKQNPSIILFHDESTFKSEEVAPKRWFFGDSAPFYSKSKGRSNMISDFVVAHPSGPFFSLNPAECARALQKYHQLGAPTDLEYVLNTASASLNVGYDNYLDNAAVLGQCERLFQMIEFKECFKGHTIEYVFDQARTHTAKSHSVNDFSRSVGTKCTVDKIQYLDPNGKARSIDCFFQSGPNKGLNKGLDVIAKELGIAQPEKFKLPALRDHLSTHPAFQNVSRLELLAQKYH
ncbi:unnamed protein product, partial [Rotaria magnacalcarata]